jgi:hypothetical protein
MDQELTANFRLLACGPRSGKLAIAIMTLLQMKMREREEADGNFSFPHE